MSERNYVCTFCEHEALRIYLDIKSDVTVGHREEPRIYLASPYSHKYEEMQDARALIVNKVAAALHDAGALLYGPITSTHHLAKDNNLNSSWEYWKELDESFIYYWATELWVLCMDGWKESVGVTAEVKAAKEAGIKIRYIKD